jgi:uncharacterized protein (TIGR02145 family)
LSSAYTDQLGNANSSFSMKYLVLFASFLLLAFGGCKKAETPLKETVTDIDGNVYNTVTIGNQVWMAENLKATRYNNGDPIIKITDQNAWLHANSGAYCAYGNIDSNAKAYGYLYNWFAVNDARRLAPPGWHIPTFDEWFTLQRAIGDYSIAGGKMKKTDAEHWANPNSGADNSSGFSGLPGGFRDGASFTGIRYFAFWWNADEDTGNTLYAFYRSLYHNSPAVGWSNYFKIVGMSVRCIKD